MELLLICHRRRTLLEVKCQRKLLGYMQAHHGLSCLQFPAITLYRTAANVHLVESRKAKLQAPSQGRK